MSKTLTRSEFDAGLARFMRACIWNNQLETQWPPASDEQKALAQQEYDLAFEAISDGPKGDWGVNIIEDQSGT